MILIFALLACGFVADLMGGEITRDQVERLCEIAGDVERRDPTAGRRLAVIGGRLAQEQFPGLELAWKAIEAAPPRLRAKVYEEMLAEAGLEDFECPPLERALTR